MRDILIFIYLFLCLSNLHSQDNATSELPMKEFIHAGRIEALMDNESNSDWLLVQLNLPNDSLFNIANITLPNMELLSGPASYHRVMSNDHLLQIQKAISEEYIIILDKQYILPNPLREFWIDVQQGDEAQGTFSEDEAIEYTCACLEGATNCIKLGWDESWYNPFDYWGEAWYAFSPPAYQSIEEIRVVVRGAQCDDLPLWSETYMGMMDDNGNWSQDYELSIEYTDNEFIVNNLWSNSELVPRIGSEDNYCIDTIRLKFYYTCNEPDIPINIEADDEEDCSSINLEWELSDSSIINQKLYRDGTLISQLNIDDRTYQDWGAQSGMVHTYCIQTQNECGYSPMLCTEGSLKSAPEVPTNVNASDGEFSNIVVISWSPILNSQEYRIYRDGSWMGFVTPENLEYTDYIPEMDIVYNYCIEAINICGASDWGCDLGFIDEPGGDINLDGSIDILDVVVLVNIIIGNYETSDDEFMSSDLNDDGIINIIDIVILTNIIIG